MQGGDLQVAFGGHHMTHVVCLEDDVVRVRRLEVSQADADEYIAQHGIFMPEHAEEISKPGAVVLEATTIDAIVELLRAGSWPYY